MSGTKLQDSTSKSHISLVAGWLHEAFIRILVFGTFLWLATWCLLPIDDRLSTRVGRIFWIACFGISVACALYFLIRPLSYRARLEGHPFLFLLLPLSVFNTGLAFQPWKYLPSMKWVFPVLIFCGLLGAWLCRHKGVEESWKNWTKHEPVP